MSTSVLNDQSNTKTRNELLNRSSNTCRDCLFVQKTYLTQTLDVNPLAHHVEDVLQAAVVPHNRPTAALNIDLMNCFPSESRTAVPTRPRISAATAR